MSKTFYWYPMLMVCSVHGNKVAAYEVKSGADRYRFACTEACAEKQVAELTEAWSDKADA